ncbi:MAG: ERAP1-like C-terminal domain-containing protein [Clostridia bacterium]|nr:ERAP1-like C-terminal domain-containing protein [Deltaproteobacteria bacterium]
MNLKVVATTHGVASKASNLPQEFRLGELPKDMIRTRFATTAPLPTYLLTFAVGPLDVVDNGPLSANDVRLAPLPFRGIAARGQGKKLEQAMRVAGLLLAALERYFGIPYPFDKLDLLAVPGFSGGMENAGAIVFSDGLLLTDSATITARQRRDMTNVVAHELAHMWFGDLVTMQWWDDLWLNEAFATWMQRHIVQQVDPSVDAELGGVDAVLRAMDTDALVSARQIHQPVVSTNEISNAFDTITYNKGMGVLAMVENYVRADKFRDAIRSYIHDYQFANATADDFFAHLDAASRDASRILRSFTDQAGAPLIDAQLTCNASGPATLTLAQQRYLPIGSTGNTESRWVIPVCARYVIGTERLEQCWVLSDPQAAVTLSEPGCPVWLTPNADALGYYRYSMSPESLKRLLTAMNARQLSRSEEIALFQTLRASVGAGRTPPADLFGSLPSFVARTDEKLDAAVIGLLLDVQSQLVDPATAKAVDDFMQTTFSKRIGKEPFLANGNETDDEKLSRTSIATLLSVELDDAPQRRLAGKHGSAVLTAIEEGKPVTTVDPQLVGTVLAVYIDEGGERIHRRVVAALENQNDPALRRELVTALARVRTNENIRRTLSTLLTPTVRTNEIWTAMWPMARRKTSRQQTWDWLRENFLALRDRVPNENQGHLIALSRFFCSPDGERELEEFFGPRAASLMGGPQIYAEARESVQLCAARAAALGEPVRAYFMGEDITRKKSSL